MVSLPGPVVRVSRRIFAESHDEAPPGPAEDVGHLVPGQVEVRVRVDALGGGLRKQVKVVLADASRAEEVVTLTSRQTKTRLAEVLRDPQSLKKMSPLGVRGASFTR